MARPQRKFGQVPVLPPLETAQLLLFYFNMSKLVIVAVAGAIALVGCADQNPSTNSPVTSCSQAFAALANCDGTGQDAPQCQDDSPAASFAIDNCDNAGKADYFGNRVWGEACSFNWQCQASTKHSCNHGTCYLRAEVGQACDRNDARDCEAGLQCADNLAVPTNKDGLCQTTRTPVRPALYAETKRANEADEFQDHAADIMGIQMRTAVKRLNGDDQIRRTFHAKKHLCAAATFETIAAPADLAVGPVFGQAQRFDAYVRLSNGTLTMTPDATSGVQGLAIKLVGVPGSKILDGQRDAVTQDFLLINLAANVVASANEFIELTKAQERGTLAVAHYLLTHPRTALRVAKVATNSVASPRTTSFWSANANRHGRLAVKYSAQPCAGTPAAAAGAGPDFMRADIKAQLQRGDICFDFYAQRQTDSVKMSIEDGTSLWDEAASVPVRIARITVPRTALDTAAANIMEQSCNELSFNPWNSAPEHQPLGNMNRSRKFAYEASKQMRRAAAEPTTVVTAR